MQWIYWCKFLYCLLVFCHKNTCWLVFFFLISFILGAGILTLMGGVLLALIIFLVVGVAIICSRRKKQKKNKPTKQEGKKNFFCFLNKQFLFFAKSLLIHQKSQKWAKVFFLCAFWSESVKPFHNFQSAEEMMVNFCLDLKRLF